LGCADGGNLIPMALTLPDAQFVGIDFSLVQIEIGRALIAELGIKNIVLKQVDILDITAEFGQFDYILAHGIYSWVPPVVRDAVLRICSNNLAPQGIAYVSYNVYPGWHVFEPIRELLRYRTVHVRDPMERLALARELVALLAVERGADDIISAILPLSANLLKERLDSVRAGSDVPILLHDIMSEPNQPVYFHEFAEHAAQHGLQYLAEANFPMVLPRGIPDRITAYIRRVAKNGIDVEQYMDLYRGRTFRQTLLCHSAIPLTRNLRPSNLTSMAISSRAVLDGRELNLQPGIVARYRSSDGANFSIDTPISKAAFVLLLDAWPRAVPFEEALDLAIAQVRTVGIEPGPRDALAAQLATDLLTAFCYSEQLANFYMCPPSVAAMLSERPLVWPLARIQANQDGPLTTMYHENTDPDALTRHLIPLLDGTNDRPALLQVVVALIAAGTISVDDPDSGMLEITIERCLRWALWSGLLIA
jgi:SAM-dependent methyltransferase